MKELKAGELYGRSGNACLPKKKGSCEDLLVLAGAGFHMQMFGAFLKIAFGFILGECGSQPVSPHPCLGILSVLSYHLPSIPSH